MLGENGYYGLLPESSVGKYGAGTLAICIDKGQKYVIANVAAFMLQAINEETDSITEMRICVGSVKNKTPLLSSRIYYMELNPYWNVPQSIIRKEIIPTYRRDTTYFTRNRMKVYDKNGLQVNPHQVNWAKYAGKRCTLYGEAGQ